MERQQDRELIQFECQALLRAKQYKSCELVSSLALSRAQSEASIVGYSVDAELFVAVLQEVLGDCAEGLGNYEEAIFFYRSAASRRYMMHSKANSTRESSQNIIWNSVSPLKNDSNNAEQVETVLLGSDQGCKKSNKPDCSESSVQDDSDRPIHRYNTRRRKKIQESQYQENGRELHVIDSNSDANVDGELIRESAEIKSLSNKPKLPSTSNNHQVNAIKKLPFKPSAALNTKSCGVALSSAEADLRLKESRCNAKLGRINPAILALERISHEFKTFAVYMQLGKLYTACGRTVDARLMYIEALRRMPLCLEAIEASIILGSSRDQVLGVVNEGMKARSSAYATMKSINENPSDVNIDSTFPVKNLVEAASAAMKYDYVRALKFYQQIADDFPRNAYISLKSAVLNFKMADFKSAERVFDETRRLDKHIVDDMDKYAFIIFQRGDGSKLNKICNELLQINENRSETWNSLALLSAINGDKEKCFAYLNKSIRLDQNNGFTHKLLGKFHLEAGRHQHAIISYFKAAELSRDLDCYEGLVDAYLSAGKFKESYIAAENAIQIAPNNSRALTLRGVVLARGATTREELQRAKRALEKALSLDPSSLRPLLTLVNIYVKESECDYCVDLLSKGMENLQTNDKDLPLLHTKLGNVFAMKRDFTNAISNFHAALALNSNYVAAQSGLEKVENLMKGGSYDIGESFTVESLD